jgi:hypothetical protein
MQKHPGKVSMWLRWPGELMGLMCMQWRGTCGQCLSPAHGVQCMLTSCHWWDNCQLGMLSLCVLWIWVDPTHPQPRLLPCRCPQVLQQPRPACRWPSCAPVPTACTQRFTGMDPFMSARVFSQLLVSRPRRQPGGLPAKLGVARRLRWVGL